MKKALTLVEMLIVVAILGILAAVALPTFQSHTQQAKEAAAKDNLRILRNAIELYAAQHNGVPPGYENGNMQNDPSSVTTLLQLLYPTNVFGQYAELGTPGYNYGPYFKKPPQNPFNESNKMLIVGNSESFPSLPTGAKGWIYKPKTKMVKIDWPGTDSAGVAYFDY